MRMQWATVVVIEQMQRWRCPTYTPRTTVVAPYSSTEVVHALPEAEKHTLLFFRRGSHPAMLTCLIGFMAYIEKHTLLFFRRGLHPAAPFCLICVHRKLASMLYLRFACQAEPGSPGHTQNRASTLRQHRGFCEACEQL